LHYKTYSSGHNISSRVLYTEATGSECTHQTHIAPSVHQLKVLVTFVISSNSVKYKT